MVLLTRRHARGLGVGALSATQFRPVRAVADESRTEAHGMPVFDDLKYPADFRHLDHVNVAAPKRGLLSFIPSVRAYN
jgi:microcin C transport system substrate-binding protein